MRKRSDARSTFSCDHLSMWSPARSALAALALLSLIECDKVAPDGAAPGGPRASSRHERPPFDATRAPDAASSATHRGAWPLRDGGAGFASDAAACASQKDADARCFYSIGGTQYCGGAAPPQQLLDGLAKWRVCVCNECAGDADCKAKPGGRCEPIVPQRCEGQAERRCVYPDEPCFACPAGLRCVLTGQGPDGEAICGMPFPLPP